MQQKEILHVRKNMSEMVGVDTDGATNEDVNSIITIEMDQGLYGEYKGIMKLF